MGPCGLPSVREYSYSLGTAQIIMKGGLRRRFRDL
jgi:hypothetical protein